MCIGNGEVMNNIHLLQSYPMPNKVIIDVEDYLINLKNAINQPSLPTIDTDVLLESIVDAVSYYPTAQEELLELPVTLIENEVFGSKIRRYHPGCDVDDLLDSIPNLDSVSENVIKTGHAFCRYFKQHGLFVDQYLNFEYDGIIDDRSILFRKRRR